MEITFAPNDVLQIDDARIIFRNFAGKQTQYNREGDRNFAVVIPDQETAEELIKRGWNVTIKPPREEGDAPFMVLKVKIKFNRTGPNVYIRSGTSMTRLSEETIEMLDEIDIRQVYLDLRAYDWEMSGKTGRTAYLNSLKVVQNVDRFMAEYKEEYPVQE